MPVNDVSASLKSLSRIWSISGAILLVVSLLALLLMGSWISFEQTHTRAAWVVFLMAFLLGFVLDIGLFPAASALRGRFNWTRYFLLSYTILVLASVPFWLGLMTVRLLPGNSLLGFYFLYGSIGVLGMSLLLQFSFARQSLSRWISLISITLPFALAVTAVLWVSFASLGDRSPLQGMENGLWWASIRVEGDQEIITHYPFFILYLLPLSYRYILGIFTIIQFTKPEINQAFQDEALDLPVKPTSAQPQPQE